MNISKTGMDIIKVWTFHRKLFRGAHLCYMPGFSGWSTTSGPPKTVTKTKGRPPLLGISKGYVDVSLKINHQAKPPLRFMQRTLLPKDPLTETENGSDTKLQCVSVIGHPNHSLTIWLDAPGLYLVIVFQAASCSFIASFVVATLLRVRIWYTPVK